MIHQRFVLRMPTALASLAVTLALMTAGCGESGPPSYDVSGTVTFDGQPVPAGKIMFEPDRSAGNEGPRGIAMIKDGQYQTLPDKGAIGGPHIVRIFGFDGIRPKGWSGSDFGTPIFPRYETKVDLPREPSTHDFDVPATR